jgi:hypothetical protein
MACSNAFIGAALGPLLGEKPMISFILELLGLPRDGGWA